MKKLLCLVLATLMIFSLIGCSGSNVPAKSTTYTVSDTVGAGDTALADFFGGKLKEELSDYAPVLFSFATALHEYPEVLEQTPDNNFGWSFLYNMLAVYDLRPAGVKASNGTIEATAEAIDTLQKDTLGGALWVSPGKDYADRVTYNAAEQQFTCVDADENTLTGSIDAAVFNAETGFADITVSLSDASGNVVDSFVLYLRAAEESSFGYVIAFMRAA